MREPKKLWPWWVFALLGLAGSLLGGALAGLVNTL